jgi:hypothetical protein
MSARPRERWPSTLLPKGKAKRTRIDLPLELPRSGQMRDQIRPGSDQMLFQPRIVY